MRNSVFATALLVLILVCGSAWAADPAAATYNWTGFYVGLNAGGAINDSGYTLSPTGEFFTEPFFHPLSQITNSGKLSDIGFTFGGQAGYNRQVGIVVYGLETDFNYDSTHDSNTGSSTFIPHEEGGIFHTPRLAGGDPLVISLVHTVNQRIDCFGTLRGRLGFTPADRFLIYATGGLAYGYVSSSSNVFLDGANFPGSSSGFQAGWTVGAGSEYALTNNCSVKLEYLYMDLGSASYTGVGQFPAPPTYTYVTNIDTAQHIIRVGINYKF
jgi:outer membrane immunogenic protein